MHHKPGLSPHATGILLFFCGLIAFGVFDAASKYLLASFPAPFLNVMRNSTLTVVGLIMLDRHAEPHWTSVP